VTFLEALVCLVLVWVAYCAVDAPALTARAAHRLADRLWGDR
jgi:hypothetical protein